MNQKTGAKETAGLVTVLIFNGFMLGETASAVRHFATGSWIAILVVTFAGVLVMHFCGSVVASVGIRSLVSAAFGRYAAIGAGIVLFVATVLNASHTMSVLTNAVGEVVLPNSPRVFIIYVASGAALAVCLLGPEAITRYGLVLGIVLPLALVGVALFSANRWQGINLFPLLGRWSLRGVTGAFASFGNALYFFAASSHIKDTGSIRPAAVSSVLTAGIMASSLCLAYLLCVPYPAGQTFDYPFYRLALMANSSVVFQRPDGFVFILWILTGFVSAGALTLFAARILGATLNLKNHRAISFGVVYLCLALTMADVTFGVWGRYVAAFGVFVFLPITCIIYKIRRPRND